MAPAAVLAVAAVVSAAGAIYAGQQQKKAAEYNANVAEANAKAAQNKAAYDEQMHRERVQRILGSQRAAYGKSGLAFEGSPLLVMQDTAAQGEMDALAIRHGGDVDAARARSEANLYRMQGQDAVTSSYFTAGSSLLSGASNISRYN